MLAHVEDGDTIPPIELECSSCNSTYVVFDPREHGYDAAVGKHGSYEVDELVQELTPDELSAPHDVIVSSSFRRTSSVTPHSPLTIMKRRIRERRCSTSPMGLP